MSEGLTLVLDERVRPHLWLPKPRVLERVKNTVYFLIVLVGIDSSTLAWYLSLLLGRCKNMATCPYLHDPTKVAVCSRFLKGACNDVHCPFSHKLAKEKMPVCRFFIKGTCNDDNCPYSHVRVNPNAKICRQFLRGYCPRGEACTDKHVYECPDFAESGTCKKGEKCPWKHASASSRLSRPVEQSEGFAPSVSAIAIATEVGPSTGRIAEKRSKPEDDERGNIFFNFEDDEEI